MALSLETKTIGSSREGRPTVDYVGIDVHSRYSEVCWLSESGEVRRRGRVRTSEAGLRKAFGEVASAKVLLESSSESPWVARQLSELGHSVTVVNPRQVRLIAESTLKCDRLDAEILARIGRIDLGLLSPVYQRSSAAQQLRMRLRVRTRLVRSRTALINTVRGLLRSRGIRLGSISSRYFAKRWSTLKVPESLAATAEPLVEMIAEISARIEQVDRELDQTAQSSPLVQRLQTMPGVGPVVSLSFVAWMDRPERFSNSRTVGACLGLRPRVRDSGGRKTRGAITAQGDNEMRRLLVQAAHAALNSRQDSELQRWARSLADRVGRKKAVIALARKIAVVMHRLWTTGEDFKPFPSAR